MTVSVELKMAGAGISAKVQAGRTRDDEWISLDIKDARGNAALLRLTRDEAYALAHQLQHEADWLTRLVSESGT